MGYNNHGMRLTPKKLTGLLVLALFIAFPLLGVVCFLFIPIAIIAHKRTAEEEDTKKNRNQPLSRLVEACQLGDYSDIVNYINAGGDINRQEAEEANTLLHIAAQYDQANLLRLFLNQAKIRANLKNSRGNTPLHSACAWNCFHAVEVLLEYSDQVDVHVKNKYGETPLELACARASAKVVELLLKKQKIDRGKLEKLIQIAKGNKIHDDVVLLLQRYLTLKAA